MTFDIIALCRKQPGPTATVAAMLAAGPDPRVHRDAQLSQLYHDDGRLLGMHSDVPNPLWWVESRAPGHDRDAEAGRFTATLVASTGGASWSNR